jgi:type IV pilus assembly protein PilA
MKKMNNKGFSLVELIIVIAIMAILIAVLAPQYLRYVEKSRLQADNSAIGEVANAVKVACANDKINEGITGSESYTFSTTAQAVSFGPASLDAELANVVGSSIQLKSNTYKQSGMPKITISIDATTKSIIVGGSGYVPEVGDTPTNINF